MGYFSSRHDAEDGRNCRRETPSHMDMDAWLSKSMTSTRRRAEVSAAARFTAIVVLPTPPFLLSTAMITGNLSGILSRNRAAARSGVLHVCNANASAFIRTRHRRGVRTHDSATGAQS